MKNLKRQAAYILSALAVTMFATSVNAGSNGSGNEPPKDKGRRGTSSVCTVFPLACLLTSDSNGSGNEPPSR